MSKFLKKLDWEIYVVFTALKVIVLQIRINKFIILLESLPPEVVSKDFDLYFRVNKKTKLKCQANDFLQPQIRWIKNNELMFYLPAFHKYSDAKQVVHSDLASRNVLLTAEANAKVTDFGLSRRTYYYTEYVKTAKDALPWRWLALESLLTNTFSCKSDVWAYGITLWEMFSLGEMPYPGMNPTLEFVEELKQGLRNHKPNYASQEIYQVMSECWHPDSNQRPSFAALRIIFQSAFSRNEANIDSKISQDSNLEEIAKELSAAVYCDL